jgi:N-acetylmuramoyl-L-alanine amidase
VLIFLWITAIKSTAYEEVKEPQFEAIPQTEEVNTEEDGELFARTHDVKIVELSYEDAQLLMKVAQAEGGNQGITGMRLIMSVILNRVKSDQFPGTVREVVYQKGQFSTVANGAIDRVEISPECHLALAEIEMGNVSPEIIAFETKSSNSLDRYFWSAFQCGNHVFYTLKK